MHASAVHRPQPERSGLHAAPLPAFAGFGIELEYAIVDRASLDVRPQAGALLADMAGHPAASFERGALGWSNELASHVIELKNCAPAPSLAGLADAFAGEIGRANALLERRGARLMPTGMHPWMDPRAETVLWTQEGAEVYTAFDRIFDCRRHGWANLQSMHVNLPFAGDAQFARLHAAIRAVLPLIPALAASSPIADGRLQPALDHRLEAYRSNSARVASVAGDVIPPDIGGRVDYETRVLAPLYRDIAPHDPHGVLQHEWLNARGAIARFDRQAIEIRLCDAQECPRADLAIAAAVVAVVRALYEERWASLAQLRALPQAALARLLRACVVDADRATIDDTAYLAVLGIEACARTAAQVWVHLLARCGGAALALDPAAEVPLGILAAQGPLARRILRSLAGRHDRAALREVYAGLCDCLAGGSLFQPSRRCGAPGSGPRSRAAAPGRGFHAARRAGR